MDVTGRSRDSPAGEYFRANVWSWRPIHDLIIELCSDLLDEETLEGIGYNDGHGPEDRETCLHMAARFEQWMERHVKGRSLEIPGARVTKDGHFVSNRNARDGIVCLSARPTPMGGQSIA